MGFLASLKKSFSNQYDSLGYKITNTALAVITSPIDYIRNPEKTYKETAQKKALKLVAEGVENTLLVVAPFSSAGKAVAVKVATALTSSVPRVISTIAGAGVLVGALKTEKGREIISSAPTPSDIFTTTEKATEKVFNMGAGELTEPEWYSIARGLGLGAGLSILASGGIYLGYKYYNGKLQKAKEEEMGLIPEPTKEKDKEKVIGEPAPVVNKPTDLGTPQTIPERATTTISPRKRYKRTKKKETPSIRINNAIAIKNSSNGLKITNKRYLNEVLY